MKRHLLARQARGTAALLAAGLLAATLLAVAAGPASARAGTLPAPSRATAAAPIRPVIACSALARRDFTGVPDAPGRVVSARLVKRKPFINKITFCLVQGVFAPHTRFRMLLPAASWHGQYVQQGCSTLCGAVPLSPNPEAGLFCAAAQNGELAMAADDEGHTGAPSDGRWARNNLVARVVFGVTSEDSLDHMARAVIAAYYGRPPAYSYYDGCSTGGREALMLAQRFPADFNGILAGSPVMNMAPQSAFFTTWMVRANTGPGGHQIVTAQNIPALHAAVIRACGNAQGIIPDPRKCGFNPASIQCPRGTHAASCLTPAQVAAVHAFYRGPTDAQGQSLDNGGEPYGSELGWIGEFVEPAADRGAPGNSPEAELALNYLKYMAFWPNPPAGFTLADVRFTAAEFRKVDELGNLLYNANDPDLRAFAALGGKLIMYHGWADQAIPPWASLDYYAAVERTMGGFRASQSFSRLYMIPGAYHCLFGPGGHTINLADFLGKLIGWVQHGAAPGPVAADTYSRPLKKIIQYQTVRPYNALAPVKPAKGSLNAHYHYIGNY
jgi:Tannase and feruloyl esterase